MHAVHRYQKSLNRLLKVCFVPASSTVLIAFFSSFLLRPLTVLMKQTRQPVRAVNQSIYLDVHDAVLLTQTNSWQPLKVATKIPNPCIKLYQVMSVYQVTSVYQNTS
jgi:hypothetical protein